LLLTFRLLLLCWQFLSVKSPITRIARQPQVICRRACSVLCTYDVISVIAVRRPTGRGQSTKCICPTSMYWIGGYWCPAHYVPLCCRVPICLLVLLAECPSVGGYFCVGINQRLSVQMAGHFQYFVLEGPVRLCNV